MNFQKLNEAFDRKYLVEEDEVVETKADELRDALTQKMFDIQNEINSISIRSYADMKKFEIGFQEVIENLYPGKSWWDVTECQIFMDLFQHVDPEHTINCIVDNLKEGVDEGFVAPGAIAGGAIGSLAGHPIAGALIGGAAGAIADNVVDLSKENEELNEENNNVILSVRFEEYGRYGDGGALIKLKAKGANEFEALKKLVNHMNLYITSSDIDEVIDNKGSFASIIDDIESSNGDGCDFIIELKNETTGETYIDASDYYDNDYEFVDEDESLQEEDKALTFKPGTVAFELNKPENKAAVEACGNDVRLIRKTILKILNDAEQVDKKGFQTAIKEFSNPMFDTNWKALYGTYAAWLSGQSMKAFRPTKY